MRYQQCDVCLYANIRIFKQITTSLYAIHEATLMFVSMQIYEFLSKSQPTAESIRTLTRCLSLCKYTNF